MTTPRFRRTWLIAGSVITVALVALGLVQVLSVIARSDVTVDVEVAADGVRELHVDVESGAVSIRGTSSDVVSVRGTVTSGLNRTKHVERIEDDRFVVRSDCGNVVLNDFCDVDHVIEVPSDMAVVVRSSNTSIALEDLDGPVDVHTSNSPIAADRLSDRVSLRTSNDSIRASALRSTDVTLRSSNDNIDAEFLVPPDRVVARTSNDALTIVVPDTDDAYDVDLDTSNGTQSAAVRTDPTSPRRIEASSSNDDVVVRYPQG